MRHNAVVNYHVKSKARQAFHFDADGIVGNLIGPELVATSVQVTDMRSKTNSIRFDTEGIQFVEHVSQVKDFDDSLNWKTTYDQELISLLKRKIGAQEVLVFDHTVRLDCPDAVRKPARNVHTDYSPAGAHQRLIDLVGQEKRNEMHNGHYGFVNVWRPVQYTIKSSPLGFIRPNSMKKEDWVTIELIYPDRNGEILGVVANEAHDWFYLSDMTPDEIAIFNIFDNGERPFLGHSALDMEITNNSLPPRKSIESRTLVRYK